MSTAKEEILARIQRATGNLSGRREAEYAAIPRDYAQSGTAQRIELFGDRLRDYGCDVYCCSANGMADMIGTVLGNRRARRLLIPAGLPSNWLPGGFEFVRDDGLSYPLLDNFEAVLTGCALAIAITGTIVLRHSPEEGRRAATLIPDYHLCVVFEEQVFRTVPEGIRVMSTFGASPMTTISGPSATSDIEMTRIKGVHGPRTLDVVLVGDHT